MQNTKNIIVAPLNWGLGHATRCIPIIKALLKNGFTPILASDGEALKLLKKEFPDLKTVLLPSYGIQYPKNAKYFTLYMLKNVSKLLRSVKKEQKIIANVVVNQCVIGIISDNRFGVYHKNIPSIYITHQLNVLSGIFTYFSSKIHQYVIKKFDECWVPDFTGTHNLSGKLGHLQAAMFPVKYIGVLSRFQNQSLPQHIDYLVLLSGPEPQRSLLKGKLLLAFKNTSKKVVFVLGNLESKQTCVCKNNITIYNFMLSDELSKTIQQSKVVISRSGYTTIMDLSKLGKKAFFIPTPGQYEQQYLATRLEALKLVPFANQNDFCIQDLDKVAAYNGLPFLKKEQDLSALFSIFKAGNSKSPEI